MAYKNDPQYEKYHREYRERKRKEYADKVKCKECSGYITPWSKTGVCVHCTRKKPHSIESRNKVSANHMAEKNPFWKGDQVGNTGLHSWVRSRLSKSELCNECKKVPPRDLANISNSYNSKTYTRDLHNWEWLCRKCHLRKDGRTQKFIDNLPVYSKAMKERTQIGVVQMDLQGNILKEFDSLKDASRETGVSRRYIARTLKLGKSKAKGYFWKYKNPSKK